MSSGLGPGENIKEITACIVREMKEEQMAIKSSAKKKPKYWNIKSALHANYKVGGPNLFIHKFSLPFPSTIQNSNSFIL